MLFSMTEMRGQALNLPDFELFGIPAKVVVGRKAAEGIVEVQYGEEVKEMQASHVTCFLSSLLNDDDTQL